MPLDFQNQEGITFPDIHTAFSEGKELNQRYISLIPQGQTSSSLSIEPWGKRILARDRVTQDLSVANLLENSTPHTEQSLAELTKFRHPHLESVSDLILDGASTLFISEFHNKFSLEANRLQISKRRDGLYTVEQLSTWFKQLFDVLEYCHDHHHSLHGNISPDNISEVSINDSKSSITLSKMYLSRISDYDLSSPFLSPQVKAGRPYTLADELYALGVTLHKLICNQLPLSSSNTSASPQSLQQIIETESSTNFRIPHHWNNAVAQCLKAKAKARPSSIAKVRELFFGSSNQTTYTSQPSVVSSENTNPEEIKKIHAEYSSQIEQLKNKLSRSDHEALLLESEKEQLNKQLNRATAELTDTETKAETDFISNDNKNTDQITQLQHKVNILNKELDLATTEKNKFSRDAKLIESETEDLRAKQTAHNNQLETKQNQLRELESHHTNLTAELDNIKKGLRPASTPILLTLLTALLLGAGLAFFTTQKTNTHNELALVDQKAADFLPENTNTLSKAVPCSLFYSYLKASDLTDDDITKLIPSFTSDQYNSTKPVTHIPYWLAERFCTWITHYAQAENGSEYYARLPTYKEASTSVLEEHATMPIWTITQKLSSSSTHVNTIGRLFYIQNGNQEIDWQIPHNGVTNQGKPIGFRIILDQIK